MNIAKLVSITPKAEETIAYIARVSNPKNQDNDQYEGLLKYMIEHSHWSPFEQAYMTIEIQTSLAIATQICDIDLLPISNLAKDMLKKI